MIPRTVQSANIPIQTPIGPKPSTRIRKTQRQNLHAHMVQQEVIMENFTSPAARRPYPGTNAIVHTTGFTMVIHVIMWMHISALVLSIPPRIVTGLTKIYTIRQLTIITASAMTQSFLCNRPPHPCGRHQDTGLRWSSGPHLLRWLRYHSDSQGYWSLPELR